MGHCRRRSPSPGKGALVNGDGRSKTIHPFLRASHLSDEARIRLFIEYGADVNASGEGHGTGMTPLQELCTWADLEIIQLMVKRGADVNLKNAVTPGTANAGGTALHTAAAAGRPEVVASLLKCGADATRHNQKGESALDYARKSLDQPYFQNGRHEQQAQAYRQVITLLETLEI